MRAVLTGMDWLPNCNDGGLNRYFYEAVHELPFVGVAGHAVVSFVQPGQTAPLTLHGMARPGADLLIRWKGARASVRTLLRERPDVINSHFALYAFPWVRALQETTRLVVNFQGPWADELATESPGTAGRIRARMAHRIERTVYHRAARVITLSDAFARIAADRYHVPREKLRVVPGGVRLDRYLAAPRREVARECLKWPQDRPILLAVRRLARRMGLELLIDAMETVRRARPDALLLIGGKGPLRPELEARIAARGVAENVRLLGFVPDGDLPLAYASADLSIVPTLALEGFGLITVESLASGTPVLGTDIGGTPEILRGLEPQLLFPSSDPEAMADHILQALSGQLPLPDRTRCREHVEQYGWSQVAPRIRAVFDEASRTR